MKLLIDEMYSPEVAGQLRRRGHDVYSVHDVEFQSLEGAVDEEIFAAAQLTQRVIVTDNLVDFRPIEAAALAGGERSKGFVFTTNRQFPRGSPATLGRLSEL